MAIQKQWFVLSDRSDLMLTIYVVPTDTSRTPFFEVGNGICCDVLGLVAADSEQTARQLALVQLGGAAWA